MLELLGRQAIPGSSVTQGVPYQDIPGVSEGHRNNSRMRANRVAELIDVKGKTVLDLGCNVGTISKRLHELGAKVFGVDYDDASISVARQYNPGPQYFTETIDLPFIRSMPHYDVIVWVSQFMWLAKQKGLEHALDCLWEIGKHCDTLIFETAGRDDGSAPIDYSQEEVFDLLCANSIFRSIEDTGQWNDLWTPRNVFVCKEPLLKHDGLWATVTPGNRGQLVKTFKDSAFAQQLKERTSMFLKLLDKYYFFPRLISEDDTSVTMSWEGPKAVFIPEYDKRLILEALRDRRITHRDISPDNLLWNGKNVVLIDFAFAVIEGDVTNASHDLGKPFRCPHGFNDEYSLMQSQAQLLRRS